MAKGSTLRVTCCRVRPVTVSLNPRTADVNAPLTVGVPDRSPVVVLIAIPGGRPVAENVYEPTSATRDQLIAVRHILERSRQR